MRKRIMQTIAGTLRETFPNVPVYVDSVATCYAVLLPNGSDPATVDSVWSAEHDAYARLADAPDGAFVVEWRMDSVPDRPLN